MNRRAGFSFLRKYPPYILLLTILSLTFYTWRHWNGINSEKERQEFQETVHNVRHDLTNELNRFEMAAKGLSGLYMASDEVTGKEFETYCRFWELPDLFPGMRFFAYARSPESPDPGESALRQNTKAENSRSAFPHIIHIEPPDFFSRLQLGRDIFEDAAWRPTADMARDTGRMAISDLFQGPFGPDGNKTAGVLLLYPAYTGSIDLGSVESRRKSLQGYIVSGVLLNELLEQCIPGSRKEKVRLTIHERTDAGELKLLYSDPHSPAPRLSLYFVREAVSLYGRNILLDFESTPAFEAGLAPYSSWVILTAGITIGLLAFFFVRSQENTRERALQMAKKMTSALQESERKYRLLAENTLDLIWQMDRDMKFTYVNPAAERITGYRPEELAGTPLSDHCCAEEMERIKKTTAETSSREEIEDGMMFETVFRHKDGHDIPVEVHSKKLFDDEWKLLGYQGTTRDISDRKRSEVEKSKLEAQFLQAQKMESVGRLAGGVAHDFNNMLAIIQGYTEMLLQETGAGQPLHQKLREIHKAAERSANLTQQLLAFARKQTVAPRVLNINDAVENTLNMMARLIGENIRLSWAPGRNLWPVRVDPAQIDHILANLCVNARDAISDKGNIYIDTKNLCFDEAMCRDWSDDCIPGEYVVLEVRDDGCGMDREVLDKLFEPFFTTKVMGKGTGLGLATIYGIVKQNNGFIHVSSSPGEGTAFTVCLPRHRGEMEPAPGEPSSGEIARASETVLLVEDEASILKMLQRVLEKQSYTVLPAGSPGEAIRLAKNYGGAIHLLITDVVMPEMNGQDLAKELLSIQPDLLCLFMSGYTADIIASHGVLQDGMHFIQKPFSIEQLSAKVREMLHADG